MPRDYGYFGRIEKTPAHWKRFERIFAGNRTDVPPRRGEVGLHAADCETARGCRLPPLRAPPLRAKNGSQKSTCLRLRWRYAAGRAAASLLWAARAVARKEKFSAANSRPVAIPDR